MFRYSAGLRGALCQSVKLGSSCVVPRISILEALSFDKCRIFKVSCCFFSVRTGKRDKSLSSNKDRSRNRNGQHCSASSAISNFSGFDEEDDPWGVSWQGDVARDHAGRIKVPRGVRSETSSVNYGRSHEDEFDFSEAEEQLEHCLEQLKTRLDDIQIGRQALVNFDALPVEIKTCRLPPVTLEQNNAVFSHSLPSRKSTVVPLSTLAQVTIRSAALVLIHILNRSDEAAITQAVRNRYPTWVVTKGVGEGASESLTHTEGVVLSLRPPKTTRQVRDQLVARAKECFNETARELHTIEEDYISEIKERITDHGWGAKEIKKLRTLAQEYLQRARKAMGAKVEALLPV